MECEGKRRQNRACSGVDAAIGSDPCVSISAGSFTSFSFSTTHATTTTYFALQNITYERISSTSKKCATV